MRGNLAPLFLYEAMLSLYPADADDLPMTDFPVWQGAVANGLRLGLEYEAIRMAGNGDRFQREHHVDESHTLEIERSWLLRKTPDPLTAGSLPPPTHAHSVSVEGDFIPERNRRYVLVMVWKSSDGLWHQRTYNGVTSRAVAWESVRALHFSNRQSWRAESFSQLTEFENPPVFPGGGGGPGGTTPVPVIITPLLPDEQSVGFFRENPLVVGEYLMGHYRWPRDVTLVSAKEIAFAPQVTANVLTLEVGGVLQTPTLTLPLGTANTEVTATVTLNRTVPAGQSVRWKITDGPDPENAAWVCAVGMEVDLT
jgi:hypothetical protein